MLTTFNKKWKPFLMVTPFFSFLNFSPITFIFHMPIVF
jgi:hypothetical protein